MFTSVVFDVVFPYKAKRLAGKNVSKMTCFMSGWTYNLKQINPISQVKPLVVLRATVWRGLFMWISLMSVCLFELHLFSRAVLFSILTAIFHVNVDETTILWTIKYRKTDSVQ